MKKNIPQQKSMICPCCGHSREVEAVECTSCGARQVGEPLAPPDITVPHLGPALISFACVLIIIIAFLAIWIFSNDLKVGRALLVSVLGDGTQLTRDLLNADAKLLKYRIVSYDAYNLAFFLSIGLVPLSVFGIWLARRAIRLSRKEPQHFGGLRLSRISLVLSASLFIIFTTVGISGIPGALERGRTRRLAATRAMMYELHQQALQKYYREYGSYPQELSDLSRVSAESAPQSDYWERSFSYSPVGVIASKGSAYYFSNYKLVSAGSDGKFGTEDDITMIDGVIVDGQSESDLPVTEIAPEKSRK
jgi:hypothetical protein